MPFSARIGFFKPAAVTPPADFPDWPTVATESEMLTEMATWGNSAVSTASTFSISGGPSGGYISATTAPDGRIVLGGRASSAAMTIYDTTNNTAVNIATTHSGTRAACLALDGNVYIGPGGTGTTFIRVNAASNTTSTFSLAVNSGYRAGSMNTLTDGNIIIAPLKSGHSFYKYDPVGGTLTNLGRTASTNNEHEGGVTSLDGNVYYACNASNNFLKYDPTGNSFSTISSGISSSASYIGANLSPSGNVYFLPYNENFVKWIDPNTDTVYTDTQNLSSEGTEKFRQGALAGDGRIYSLGYREGGGAPDNVLIIDENASPKASLKSYGITYQNDRAIGAAADFNGRVINARLTAITQMLNINTNATAYEGNAVLQPYIAGM